MNNITDIKNIKHLIKFIVDSLNNDETWEYNEHNSDQLINRSLGIKIKYMPLQTLITAFNSNNQPAKIRIADSWWDTGNLKKAISDRISKCIDKVEIEDDDAVIKRFVKIIKENCPQNERNK